MCLGNTVKFTHMAPCLIPKILNAVNMVMAVSKQLGVVNAIVLELTASDLEQRLLLTEALKMLRMQTRTFWATLCAPSHCDVYSEADYSKR